jgi:shikimate kinase
MRDYTHIILMGMKHTGKSTVGALLAQIMKKRFFDTDTVIAELSGKTPRELFEEGGSDLMKEWETGACRYLTGLSGKGADDKDSGGYVIATGGGIADNEDALKMLKKNGLFVYLDTPFDILFERILESADRDGRLPPFLSGADPKGRFLELFRRRTAIYAIMADMHLQSLSKTPVEITQEIMDYITYEQRTNIHSRG